MDTITVQTTVDRDVTLVWRCWTDPIHVVSWNQASSDWHCPRAVNDLTVGGTFTYTMAARDGSVSFDFTGTYTDIVAHSLIRYTLADGRKVEVSFTPHDSGSTTVIETFEMEGTHSRDQQQSGWEAILDGFKSHCESVVE